MSDRTVRACPDCDAADVATRRPEYHTSTRARPEADERYRCNRCGALFNEPTTRPANGHSAGGGTLTAKLQNAKPEDLP